jgi:hypothetical protein
MGKPDKALKMPPVRDSETMPVVLSGAEVRCILSTTANLKHRVLIGFNVLIFLHKTKLIFNYHHSN